MVNMSYKESNRVVVNGQLEPDTDTRVCNIGFKQSGFGEQTNLSAKTSRGCFWYGAWQHGYVCQAIRLV